MEDYKLFLNCHMLRVEEGSQGEEKKYREVQVGAKMDETPAHTTWGKTMNLGDEANPNRDNWKGVPPEVCACRIPLMQRAVPIRRKRPHQKNNNYATQVKDEISRITVEKKFGDMKSLRERLYNLKKFQWATEVS